MKPKILGIGNRDEYQYVMFHKSRGLLTFLAKTLVELEEFTDVADSFFVGKSFESFRDKNAPLQEADIEALVDERFNAIGDDFNLDIIFGKDRVFLIGHLTDEKRKILMKNLKQCEMMP